MNPGHRYQHDETPRWAIAPGAARFGAVLARGPEKVHHARKRTRVRRAMVSRLGHTDEVINEKDEKLTVKRIPLKMLGGMDVCHTRSWGGCNALVTYTGG